MTYQVRCILRVRVLDSVVAKDGQQRWFARGTLEWDLGVIGVTEVSVGEATARTTPTTGSIVLTGGHVEWPEYGRWIAAREEVTSEECAAIRP